LNETELKQLLETLHKNLNILREREAKYGGNAPLDLLNQIEDHQTAIGLIEPRLAGEISAAWQGVLANGTLLPYLEFSAPNGTEVLYPTMQSIIAGHDTPEKGLALIEQSREKFLDSL
jgi:hypothetical protein